MKNLYTTASIALCFFFIQSVNGQIDTNNYKYGLWQSFGDAASIQQYPNIQGRLANFSWKDFEPSPNSWDWTEFDNEMASKAADGLPIIFLIYTKEDAPDWLYSNGVPKVTEKDDAGNVTGYSPYYADADYKFYFKRMVDALYQHIEQLPANVRSAIIGVQPCFGSTGDYISYKGNVPAEYTLTDADFFALFQEFSTYYYDAYKPSSPKIYLLHNPNNKGEEETLWIEANCPGGWLKTGTLGKGYQLNYELDKAAWLMPILNMPTNDGNFMRARSELMGGATNAPWWDVAPYKNMFTIMGYAIHWGMDWSNQSIEHIHNSNYNPAYELFNKYAGIKDPTSSNNAMCMLKDVIDASDSIRFPAAQYGEVALTSNRFNNVLAPYTSYGAKLEDMESALAPEMFNIGAKGTNDVGWHLFPGNYERYLHQLNANATSAGFWNVECANVNSPYGRFARGFDLAKGKDALYFNVEDAFLQNIPLDSAYPVMIEITYLDKGFGSWSLLYDGMQDAASSALTVTCTNTNDWKKASVTIRDAYFGNRGIENADFYIKNAGSENVIFSLIELSRSGNGVTTSNLTCANLPSFDTICVNSSPAVQQFLVTGKFLDNTDVIAGPLEGFQLSFNKDTLFADSLILTDHGTILNKSIYIKFIPTESRSYTAGLPIYGGGAPLTLATVTGVAINTAPDISASLVKNVSCYNKKDGFIDLQPSGGEGPFSYTWTSSTIRYKSFDQHIDSLKPATYTLIITSAHGCTLIRDYVISQPEKLTVLVTGDEMQCKGDSTTVYVDASGGTLPYAGTGTFVKSAGYEKYQVTDSNGCVAEHGYSVRNGSSKVPVKPGFIEGDAADASGVCGEGNFDFLVQPVEDATFYVWSSPINSTISASNPDSSQIILETQSGFNGGLLTVQAGNACGLSLERIKTLTMIAEKPGEINGPQEVKSKQEGITFSVAAVSNLTYLWEVPRTAQIVSGQNTANIVVNWGDKKGQVKVQAINECGSSTYTRLDVDIKSGGGFLSAITSNALTVQESNTGIKAFPNPAKDKVSLAFTALKSYRYLITIMDLTGKVILQKQGTANTGYHVIDIDVSKLSPAIYKVNLINLENNDHLSTNLIKG